jgi:AcrR family transcriptional regulator
MIKKLEQALDESLSRKGLMRTEQNCLDPRITRTRQALRQALIELIQLKGYSKTTVKDITQHAGLNRSTFYLHFQNKDDLLTSGFEELWDGLKSSLPLGLLEESEHPVHISRAALVKDYQRLEEFRPFYRALLGRNGAALFKRRLRDQVLASIRELLAGSFRTHSEQELIRDASLAFLSAAYLGLLDWWLDGEAPCSPERMTDLFLQLLCLRPCDMIGFDPHPGKGDGL